MPIKSIPTQQIALSLVLLLIMPSITYAKPIIIKQSIDINRLCEAIHKAEGNDNYGILTKYKHTSPRQACINTIKHRIRDYNNNKETGDFIDYLGKTYCPVGASNDPNGLNKNWVRNVKYYYYKEVK